MLIFAYFLSCSETNKDFDPKKENGGGAGGGGGLKVPCILPIPGVCLSIPTGSGNTVEREPPKDPDKETGSGNPNIDNDTDLIEVEYVTKEILRTTDMKENPPVTNTIETIKRIWIPPTIVEPTIDQYFWGKKYWQGEEHYWRSYLPIYELDNLQYTRFRKAGFFQLKGDPMWGWENGIWKGKTRPWIPKFIPQMDKLIDGTEQQRRVWWDVTEVSYERIEVKEKRAIYHPGSAPKQDTVRLLHMDGTPVNTDFLERSDAGDGFIVYMQRSVTKEQPFRVVKVIEWIASLEPR